MRRSATRWLSVLFAAVLALLAVPGKAGNMFVFFGSAGSAASSGFYLAKFDTGTGQLTAPVFLQAAVAPTYFVIRPDGKRLYTCNSAPGSSVSAYEVDPKTAKLKFLNQKPSGGGDPCYVSLDATSHFLMVANYGGGSIAVFALQPDGSIGERTAFVQHSGSSVNRARQSEAHTHSVRVEPTNKFVLAADLGADKVFIYRFDSNTGALKPNDPPFATVPPGSGPRHMAFSPSGLFLYLINELGNSVIRYGWDSEHGILTQHESIPALPEAFNGTSYCAEILVHPSGNFVFATNRGDNSIAVFAVEAETGRLTPVEHISTKGKTPRNCEIDPTGKWLIVSNQGSDGVVVFRIDQKSGRLSLTGDPVPVPAPFCERFLSVGK